MKLQAGDVLTGLHLALAGGVLVWTLQAGPSDLSATLLPEARGQPLVSAGIGRELTAGEPAVPEVERTASGLVLLDLARFAFPEYDPPYLRREDSAAFGPADFPNDLGDYHEQRVAVRGYLLVLEIAGRGAESVLLTRFPPGCCFGRVPVADEWIDVQLSAPFEDTLSAQGQVIASGVLHVGEVLDADGFLLHLYQLRDAKLQSEP